jgi:hypothetical protein
LNLGVGSTKQNEDGENEDPEELATSNWKRLLDEDEGVYSLKPWEDDLEANKASLAPALREIMRQS